MKRTPLIAGNWKMNMNLAFAKELVDGIHFGLRFPGEVDVVVAPPFTALAHVAGILKDSYIGVSAQNLHWEPKGAFTGEISGEMIKDAGADYVIIGHSERRQYFGETNESINKKIKAAFKYNLIPIFCIGETLSEREAGMLETVIYTQVSEGLKGLSEMELKDTVIAYEPVWAIGTGKVATTEQIEEVHLKIREYISKNISSSAAQAIRILYGGSVTAANSKEILKLQNVDGALVGGASLKAQDFIQIIKNAV